MTDFTPTQGRYLSFIQAYIDMHGYPPAESEIAAAMVVSPPSVNLMVKALEKRGLILRRPGQPRSIQIIIPDEQIPPWNSRTKARRLGRPVSRPSPITVAPAAPPANLYVLTVWLLSGPVSEKYTKKQISRVIEIRGDQTLEQLHDAIFQAYDRQEQHMYEFQFGKRPFDPDGPNYGIPDPELAKKGRKPRKKPNADAGTTKLDDLGLKPDRVFGYWFDFGADWFHQIEVERVEKAIPTVTYPRVTKRVGTSPPQYFDK